jgi:hypothetical protein
MSFYMITEGMTQIEELFIGKTKEEVVCKARPMIDQFPEYKPLDNEEILELLESEVVEFDLVEIDADWPGDNFNREQLIALYNHQQDN